MLFDFQRYSSSRRFSYNEVQNTIILISTNEIIMTFSTSYAQLNPYDHQHHHLQKGYRHAFMTNPYCF
jgi:hypothetical protein